MAQSSNDPQAANRSQRTRSRREGWGSLAVLAVSAAALLSLIARLPLRKAIAAQARANTINPASQIKPCARRLKRGSTSEGQTTKASREPKLESAKRRYGGVAC